MLVPRMRERPSGPPPGSASRWRRTWEKTARWEPQPHHSLAATLKCLCVLFPSKHFPSSFPLLLQDAVLPPAFALLVNNKDTFGGAVKPTDPSAGITESELQEKTLFSDGRDQEAIKSKSSGEQSASRWCHWLAAALCLLLGLSSLLPAAALGTRCGNCGWSQFQRPQTCIQCVNCRTCLCFRFSDVEALLWLQSLFFSLASCVFLVQPAVVHLGCFFFN